MYNHNNIGKNRTVFKQLNQLGSFFARIQLMHLNIKRQTSLFLLFYCTQLMQPLSGFDKVEPCQKDGFGERGTWGLHYRLSKYYM